MADSKPHPRRALHPPLPTNTPRSRSFSDTAATPPNSNILAPSPSFRDDGNGNGISSGSKDDHAVITTPLTSRRTNMHNRGLSLNVPTSIEMPSPSRFARPVPLSPQLDQHNIFVQQSQSLNASPATSLPRHSRGLDFSRACTNLHHSTLAVQSSPDSSPTIMQRGMAIPPRKNSMSSMMLDSPAFTSNGWGSMHERGTLSSSMGSVMMVSESESSDSDEDAIMGGDENDDPILQTPHVNKFHNASAAGTPFALSTTTGASWGMGSLFSPAQTSLMKNIRRSRIQKNRGRNRRKPSSASNSAMASPRTTSPPPMRSIETTANGGYFSWTPEGYLRENGRESRNPSSGNDSGDEASHSTTPSTPGVVRRPVTRRHNLLPKTKGFARVRAALAEEATPIDTEARREAETVRQVRERDGSTSDLDLNYDSRPQTQTAQSSPNLLPAVMESAQEDFGRELDDAPKGLGMNFASHASRNSGGIDYWNRFDPSLRTPPPPTFRQNNSTASDMTLDTESNNSLWRRPRAHSSTSDASDAFGPSSSNNNTAQVGVVSDDMHLKKFKRRREDDLELAIIKRRAVSPGMSTQNSPVLTHSPSQRDGPLSLWGQPPPERLRKDSLPPSASSDVSQSSQSLQATVQSGNKSQLPSQPHLSRHGSGGSTVSQTSTTAAGHVGPGKKLGLQGMLDTNDGLMKMTIE